MVAAGNDFIVIDHTQNIHIAEEDLSSFVLKNCRRQFGVGADGVLLLERSIEADFRMRIINPDTSEVSMCGNGIRCAARYAYLVGYQPEKMTIETGAGILGAEIIEDEVKVRMIDPEGLTLNQEIALDDKVIEGHFVNTGVEHVVIFVDDISGVDVAKMGAKIRHHVNYSPKGTNVNFVEVGGSGDIRVRTYERGVEDETYACGTGSTASAIISGLVKNTSSPTKVETSGGAVLTIFFDKSEGVAGHVYMQGDARVSYRGRIEDV